MPVSAGDGGCPAAPEGVTGQRVEWGGQLGAGGGAYEEALTKRSTAAVAATAIMSDMMRASYPTRFSASKPIRDRLGFPSSKKTVAGESTSTGAV